MTNSPYSPYPDAIYSSHNPHWPNSNATSSYISSAAMNAAIGNGSNALTTLTNISAAVAAQNNHPLLNSTTNSSLTNGSLSNTNCMLTSVNNTNHYLTSTMNSSNLSAGFNMLNSTTNNSSTNSLKSQSDSKSGVLTNFNHHHHQKRKRRILFTQPQVSTVLDFKKK